MRTGRTLKGAATGGSGEWVAGSGEPQAGRLRFTEAQLQQRRQGSGRAGARPSKGRRRRRSGPERPTDGGTTGTATEPRLRRVNVVVTGDKRRDTFRCPESVRGASTTAANPDLRIGVKMAALQFGDNAAGGKCERRALTLGVGWCRNGVGMVGTV